MYFYMKKVMIDMDGVLCNFQKSYDEQPAQLAPVHFLKVKQIVGQAVHSSVHHD